MSKTLSRLLAFTRHSPGESNPLCTACLDADLRAELGSLSHAQDMARLHERGEQK